MDVGVVQHVFRGCSDDDARFARAKALGVPCVEADLTAADLASDVATFAAGGEGETCTRGPRLQAIRAASERHGVAVSSLCLGFHNGEGLVFAQWRGETPAHEIAVALRWCRALGAGALLVPFFFANEPKNASQRRQLAERLRPLARLAAALGVQLCFEGTLTATELWELADRVGGDGFGVYFDPGNSLWLERDPAAEARALGKLLRRCHLKDTLVHSGDALLGTGRLDGPGLARALVDVGYHGPVVLEAFGRPEADLVRELEVARTWFAEA